MPGHPHLSQEQRESIVRWAHIDQLPVVDIAALAGCSSATVYRILQIYNETGQTSNPLAQSAGRPRTLTTDDINYIHSVVTSRPAIYLDELQEQLFAARDVHVSIATLSRVLCRLAYSRKSISRSAAEQNEHLRATWRGAYADIPKEYFVWLDESSVDDRTNQRTQGWSQLGQACVRREIFLRGQRYSVLPALTVDGMVALDIFEGSVTKERFISFLENQIAPLLNLYPGPRSVVVLDNCAIHHDEEVRRIVEGECGARLIYLPPYSPDMNPIEQGFHSLKAWLRRHEAEAVNAAIRPWLIHQAVLSITPEHALGFIRNCGYE